MTTDTYYTIQYNYPINGWQEMGIRNNRFTDLAVAQRTMRRMEEFECATPGTVYRIVDSAGEVVE